jgi:hypothetical protein
MSNATFLISEISHRGGYLFPIVTNASASRSICLPTGVYDRMTDNANAPAAVSDASVFPRLNTMAIIAMNQAAKAMTEVERTRVGDAITNESIEAIQPYVERSNLVFGIASNIAVARR